MVGDEDVPLLGLTAHLEQRGPVDNHHLDIDTRFRQLPGEHRGLVKVGLVVCRHQQADRRAGVAGLLGEILRLLGIVLAVCLDARRRVPEAALRIDRRLCVPQALVAECDALRL